MDGKGTTLFYGSYAVVCLAYRILLDIFIYNYEWSFKIIFWSCLGNYWLIIHALFPHISFNNRFCTFPIVQESSWL